MGWRRIVPVPKWNGRRAILVLVKNEKYLKTRREESSCSSVFVLLPFTPIHHYWITIWFVRRFISYISTLFFLFFGAKNSFWWIHRWPLICATVEQEGGGGGGGASEMEGKVSSGELWRESWAALINKGRESGGRLWKENACTWKGVSKDEPTARPQKPLLFSKKCGKVTGFQRPLLTTFVSQLYRDVVALLQ